MTEDKTIEVFKKGEIVIFPTDTAFGIGCRMDREDIVQKIFEIRARPSDKALLVLVDSIEMAEKYVEFDEKTLSYAKRYWPGGVTMILPCIIEKVPSAIRAGGTSLAVRMPKHNALLQIIKEVGVPLVAPSANISGAPTPYSLDEVSKGLIEQVDYIMQGECTYKKESTIIDTTVSPWHIVRMGAVQIDL